MKFSRTTETLKYRKRHVREYLVVMTGRLSIFADYSVVARLFDVSLPLEVSHEDCLAYVTGILPAVVVTSQL